MSTTMVAHRTTTITHEMITAASMLIRITHADDASLARALGKAEMRLFEQPWVIADGQLHIASYSHPTDVNLTDGIECTCPTSRGTCYHIAAWMVLSTVCAAGINPIAPLPLPLAALDEDIDDYPGDFLSSLEDEAPPTGVWYKGFYYTPEELEASELARDGMNLAAFEEVDELPVYVPLPRHRVSRVREIVPDAGSDFERTQADADQLFAA